MTPIEQQKRNEPYEQAVIGALSIYPEIVPDLMSLIPDARMMHKPEHVKIWWLALFLHRQNRKDCKIDAIDIWAEAGDTSVEQFMADIEGRKHEPREDDRSMQTGFDLEVLTAAASFAPAKPETALKQAKVIYRSYLCSNMADKMRLAWGALQKGTKDPVNVCADTIEELQRLVDLVNPPESEDHGSMLAEAFRTEDLGSVATWGMPKLDERLPICEGSLIAVSGQSGSGKTMLAIQAMMESANNRVKCLFLTYEMSGADLMKRCATTYTGTNFREYKTKEQRASLDQTMADVMQHVEIDDSRPTAERLSARLRNAQRAGVELVFVDHMSLIQSDDMSLESHQVIKRAIDSLMYTCTDTGLAVIALCQHNASGIKAMKDKDGAKIMNGQPTMDSLLGGRAIQQNVHAHLGIWPQHDCRHDRPAVVPMAICCDKNRHGEEFRQAATFNGSINSWTAATPEEVAALQAGSSSQAEPPMTKEKRYKGAHSEDEDLFG